MRIAGCYRYRLRLAGNHTSSISLKSVRLGAIEAGDANAHTSPISCGEPNLFAVAGRAPSHRFDMVPATPSVAAGSCGPIPQHTGPRYEVATRALQLRPPRLIRHLNFGNPRVSALIFSISVLVDDIESWAKSAQILNRGNRNTGLSQVQPLEANQVCERTYLRHPCIFQG